MNIKRSEMILIADYCHKRIKKNKYRYNTKKLLEYKVCCGQRPKHIQEYC